MPIPTTRSGQKYTLLFVSHLVPVGARARARPTDTGLYLLLHCCTFCLLPFCSTVDTHAHTHTHTDTDTHQPTTTLRNCKSDGSRLATRPTDGQTGGQTDGQTTYDDEHHPAAPRHASSVPVVAKSCPSSPGVDGLGSLALSPSRNPAAERC